MNSDVVIDPGCVCVVCVCLQASVHMTIYFKCVHCMMLLNCGFWLCTGNYAFVNLGSILVHDKMG